jgi:hypothetical protein
MGNLKGNMTEEEWEEAERKALMTDDEKAMEQAFKDIDESLKENMRKSFEEFFTYGETTIKINGEEDE